MKFLYYNNAKNNEGDKAEKKDMRYLWLQMVEPIRSRAPIMPSLRGQAWVCNTKEREYCGNGIK
jgi:hypothetical protein